MPKSDHVLTLAVTLATELRQQDNEFPIPTVTIVRDAKALVKLGAAAHRQALARKVGITRYINGEARLTWSPSDEARADKKEKAIKTKANDILRKYKAFVVKAAGVYRGFSLIIYLPSARTNIHSPCEWGV